MKYREATGRTIKEDFDTFHEKHPEVYEMFKSFARDIVKAFRRRYVQDKNIRTSSKLIINRIRWEQATFQLLGTPSEIQAANKVFDKFKINDAFTSHYARLFQDDIPKWAHIFHTRELRD